ncbi:MAG: right-handed parallel beta-helix repeat-containing protein [Desulfobulbales bacterium]|nr:right-handed parallel beta-helix repeat-containing protein [Desulfobulbales bacterium]
MMKYLLAAITTLFLLSCAGKQGAPLPAPLMYQDHVITEDTVWQGEVLITGVVLVARKATLTIKPGTRIRFRRIDRNNDDIGDSEIRILGRLIAEGLPGSPIIFSSAEPDPQPKDWSYLLIFTSGKTNSISFCEFRHAFTGVQVHFSSAAIANSLFENNYEGIRFGRARLSITHNLLRNNDVGIRFTRMEGPVVIRSNEIGENRLGIFLVPSGQNIQDFFEPDRSGRPWNTGRLLITENNIHDNSGYNLSLGAKQLWDLDITGNWWGSPDHNSIMEDIFDKNYDTELGKAIIMPYADRPFDNAGILKTTAQ